MPSTRKYEYRRNLPHYQKDNRPNFVTFRTYRHWVLPAEARHIALDVCLRQHEKMIRLHAVVVMPDHVHLVLTGLRDNGGEIYTLAEIMKKIKGTSAHEINRLLMRKGPVWQDESFDHVLRCQESLEEKVDYVLQNPVRAGLVSQEGDYPWKWCGLIPVL